MASTTTIASVIQSLQQSTGAIKAKATQIVSAGHGIAGAGQTFQLTGDALANLQDQINNTRRNALSLAQYVSNVPTTISVGSDTQLIFNNMDVLVGSPNLTFNYTTGYLTVLSVDGHYSVAIGEPATGIGLIVEHLTTSDKVEVAGKSITSLKAGVAGKTIWFLADNGSGDGTFGVSNGSGTGGFDSNGAFIYGQAATGELQLQVLAVGAPGSGGWDTNGAKILATGSSGLLQSYGTQVGSTAIYIVTYQSSITGVNAGSNVFYLTTTASAGVFAVCNGSGSGGFDTAGASILAQGANGTLQVVELFAQASPPTTGFGEVALQPGLLYIKDPSGNTVMEFNANSGALLQVINASTLDTVDIAGASITSLAAGVHGDTLWSLYESGGYGNLALSSGSGSGGFDTNGATILLQGPSGSIQCETMLVALAPPGSGSGDFQANPGEFHVKDPSGNTAFQFNANSTYSATSATSGSASALPGNPAGYLIFYTVSGPIKFAYWNP